MLLDCMRRARDLCVCAAFLSVVLPTGGCESGSSSSRGDAVSAGDSSTSSDTNTNSGLDEQGLQTVEAASVVAGGLEAAATAARALAELDLTDLPSTGTVDKAVSLLNSFFGDCVTVEAYPPPAFGASVTFVEGGCNIPTTSIGVRGKIALVIEANGGPGEGHADFRGVLAAAVQHRWCYQPYRR